MFINDMTPLSMANVAFFVLSNSSEITFLDFSGDPAAGLSLVLPEDMMLENLFPLTRDQWLLIAKRLPESDKLVKSMIL